MLKKLSTFWDRLGLSKDLNRYLSHNRAQWPSYSAGSDEVVLVDFFNDVLVAHAYSFFANFLASQGGQARIGLFYFPRTRLGRMLSFQPRLQRIFASFGGRMELSFRGSGKWTAQAKVFSRKAILELKDKQDLLNIEIEGIRIGDLIYQSYLRNARETLDIEDVELERLILEAYLIFRQSESYFRSNKVRALIISHTIFIHYGILTRVASRFGVPVFRVLNSGWRKDDFLSLVKVDPKFNFQNWPYWKFRKIFEALSEEKKQSGLSDGKKFIETWISGVSTKIGDQAVLRGKTSWSHESDSKRILEDSGRKRVLILANCFFDGPHFYRSMLFPDFWEWINFTLSVAETTDFEWYVKAHPLALPANQRVFKKLREMFPRIHFLPSTVSNRQLVKEGISAAVSVYGTAIHEFASLGIPVIAAGDALQADFDFYFKPTSKLEYEGLLRRAGELSISVDPQEVYKFVYMNYRHFYGFNERKARPYGQGLQDFVQEKCGGNNQSNKVLGYLAETASETSKSHLNEYFARITSAEF